MFNSAAESWSIQGRWWGRKEWCQVWENKTILEYKILSQERFTGSLPAAAASGLMVWIFHIRALPHGEISKNTQLPENWEKLKENLGEGQSFKPGHCLTSTKNQGVSATSDSSFISFLWISHWNCSYTQYCSEIYRKRNSGKCSPVESRWHSIK